MSNVLLAALLLASTQGISGQISNFKIFKKKKGICGVKVSFFVAKGLFQVFFGGFSDLKLWWNPILAQFMGFKLGFHGLYGFYAYKLWKG